MHTDTHTEYAHTSFYQCPHGTRALTRRLVKLIHNLLEDLHRNAVGLLFMEKVEVVCGSNGQDVVPRVPHRMQDSPGIVQALDAYLVAPTPRASHHFAVAQYLSQLAHVPRGLVAVLHAWVAVEDAEEVVVAATDDGTAEEWEEQDSTCQHSLTPCPPVPTCLPGSNLTKDIPVTPVPPAFKSVKDEVILVERAELAAEVVVHVVGLQWPPLHVEVPQFQREEVPRQEIAATVAELHV